MSARMANAIARTIPKANANLAGSGFGATSPPLARDRCPDFRGANRERCVIYVTLRWLSKKASSAKKESRLTRIYPCRRQPVRSICRTRSLPQRSRGVLASTLTCSSKRTDNATSRAGQARHPDAARWRLAIDDRDALTSTPRAALIVAIDRGVRIASAKNFRPALEHPPPHTVCEFFTAAGRRFRKANFDGAQVTRSGTIKRSEFA